MKRKNTSRLKLNSITVCNLTAVVGGARIGGDNTACTGNESGCVVEKPKCTEIKSGCNTAETVG